MRTCMIGLLIAASSTWALSEVAFGDEVECKTKIVKITKGDGGEAKVHVNLNAGEDGAGTFAWVADTGEEVDVSEKPRVMFFSRKGDGRPVNLAAPGEDANRGWLGVQIGQITSMGDSEVTRESDGLKILNVAAGSPAEAAGFQQGDVVIEVNDVGLDGEVGGLVEVISSGAPGDRMKFTVLRDGERRNIVANLGSRAEMGNVNWIFESSPDAEMHDSLQTKARVMLRGEGGEWVMGDLAELHDLHLDDKLHNIIVDALPHSQGRTMQVTVDNGQVTMTTTVTRDDATISVSLDGDGEITVMRKNADGVESTTTYASAEELLNQDAEAHAIYLEALDRTQIHHGPGSFVTLEMLGENLIDVDTDEILGNLEVEVEGLGNAMGNLQNNLQNVHLKVMPEVMRIRGMTRRSIHENSDGTIQVTIRKGGDELVTHYDNAADLEARSPVDYEAYLKLLDAEIEPE